MRVRWLLLLLLMLAAMNVMAQDDADEPLSLIAATPEETQPIFDDSVITLTFNQALDCGTVPTNVGLIPEVGYQLDCADDTLTLTINGELTQGTFYTVRLREGLAAANGNTLGQPLDIRYSAPGRLSIQEVIPADSTANIAREGRITVVFDRPVVPIVIGQEQDDLPDPLTISPPIAGDGEWVNTFIYTFTPVELGFSPATTYVITVDETLTAQDGTQLAEEVFWMFTTDSPELEYVTPDDGAEDVRLDPEIDIRFTAGVDREALEAAFTLTKEGDDTPVPGTFEWLEGGRWYVTFEPDAFLEADSTYIGRIDNAVFTEIAGFGLDGQLEWSFSTLPFPQLVSTSPEDEDEVRSYSGFTLKFNTFMDADSITERLTITPEPTFLSGYRSRFDYRASFSAEASTEYSVRVEPGIKDIYGNIYDEPIEFTFSTLPYSPSFSLRIPFGPVGFYNAYNDFTGLFVRHRNVETLDVSLYTLDVADFVRLYLERDRELENIYNYDPSIDSLLRSWEVDLDNVLNTNVPSLVTLGAGQGCEGVELAFTLGDIVAAADDMPVDVLETWVDGPLVLTLYPGFEAQITGGPICTDLGNWWQVEVAGAQGWVDGEDLTFIEHTTPGEIPVTAADGAKLAPGLYHLQMQRSDPAPREDASPRTHNLIVSTAVLTLKHSYDDLMIWATDVQTAQPIPNAPVTVYNEQAEVIAAGVTDADGLLLVPTAGVDSLTFDRRVAVLQTDVHFGIGVTGWADGIDPGSFEEIASFNDVDYEVAIYLDRQAYRPGETVYYRGMVRSKDDMTYTVPEAFDTVDVSYSNGQETLTDEVALTPYGTFSGSFDLVDDAAPGGYYSVDVQRRSDTEEGTRLFYEWEPFAVAEFRLPEFEVIATPERDDIANGDDLRVTLEGAYYFGGSVRDAEVDYSIIASPLVFNYTGEGRYRFYQPWQDPTRDIDDDFRRSRQVATGEETIGESGIYLLELDADLGEYPGSQRFDIEATVRDVSDQSVSGRTTVNIHAGEYYIGTNTERYVTRVGEEANIDMVLVDWDSVGIGDETVTVEAYKREWFSVQTRDPVTGYTEWEYEVDDTLMAEGSVNTAADGTATYTFQPEEGGFYVIYFTIRDDNGNEIRGWATQYVSSREYVSWRMPNNFRTELIADRDEYNVGDTAQIMITSPFQGEATALITVERADVITTDIVTLDSNSAIYALEIEEDFAPNVYVSVMIVKGVDEMNPVASFRMGLVQIPVNIEQKRVTVELEADAERYQPRDGVTYTVRTTDYAGEPVVAEVGVALTDRAALDILPPPSIAPDWLLQEFYYEQGVAVRTSTPLTINTDFITQSILDATKGGGGGGGISLPSNFTLREDFVSTAYWNATVITDENGEATFDLVLPDNLTSFQLNAFAITLGDDAPLRVGQGTDRIISTLPVLVRPVTPRFMIVNDELFLGAVVNNNSGDTLTVNVSIEALGVELFDDATQTVVVEDGAAARVSWRVRALNTDAAELVFLAESSDGTFTDASRPTLGQGENNLIPIYRYEAPETVGTSGALFVGGERVESVQLPDFEIEEGALDITLEPSLAGATLDGVSYLRNFPDQCVEQTISRFLPNIMVFRALNTFDLADETLRANLDEAVDFALQKLYAEQKVDGGWGWYLREASHPLTTAYALIALTEAQAQGYAITPEVISDATEYIQGELLNNPGLDRAPWQLNRQAFLLYALARSGNPDVARTANLYEQRARLNLDARAFLAMTLHIIDPEDTTRIDTLLSDFNNNAVFSATGVRWEETYFDRWNWSSDIRTSTVILMAYTQIRPESEILPQAVRWLVTQRERRHWSTTQETAWAVMALTDWMVASGELRPDYSFGVTFNGDEALADVPANTDTVLDSTELSIQVADMLQGEANRIGIQRTDGDGALYYTAFLNTLLPVPEIVPLDRGLSIERRYTLLGDETETPISEARIGDIVQARLTIIVPNTLRYVNIEDPLPAGMEAIDPNLMTSTQVGTRPNISRTDRSRGWGWWWFSNIEFRDEKVVLSTSYLPPGVYEFVYTMRPTIAGTFNVIPPTGQEFYFPDIYGRGSGMAFTIIPAGAE